MRENRAKNYIARNEIASLRREATRMWRKKIFREILRILLLKYYPDTRAGRSFPFSIY